MATSSDRQVGDSNAIRDEFAGYRKALYSLGQAVEAGTEIEKTVSDFYDTWAERGYDEMQVNCGWEAPHNLAAVASEFLPDRSSRILDAAAGTGMVGLELKNLGFTSMDALDPSPTSLDHCKEHQCYNEYICDTLDEHKTNIQDDQYDAVVMCGAFGVPGHVNDSCFPELIRITKPGGFIMFTLGDKVKDEWEMKLNDCIAVLNKQGKWEVVARRRIEYYNKLAVGEKATVSVIRVLPQKKKKINKRT